MGGSKEQMNAAHALVHPPEPLASVVYRPVTLRLLAHPNRAGQLTLALPPFLFLMCCDKELM